MSIHEIIAKQLADNPVVLYMKGTPAFPQCGFSGKAVQILREAKVDFLGVNVLDDDEIRQGIKEYGSWPTIPQLYINGELIGGSDIMQAMYANGELLKLLEKA